MRKILIVVDMQNDFVNDALGTPEARAIMPNVVEKIKEYDNDVDEVYFTCDYHTGSYLETQEGKMLPIPHCIIGTAGFNLVDEIRNARPKNDHSLLKDTFGFLDWGIIEKYPGDWEIESIELCGVCTDICVVSNALILKAHFPEVPIYVDSKCCAGVTPEKHEAALETMRSCQIYVK